MVASSVKYIFTRKSVDIDTSKNISDSEGYSKA